MTGACSGVDLLKHELGFKMLIRSIPNTALLAYYKIIDVRQQSAAQALVSGGLIDAGAFTHTGITFSAAVYTTSLVSCLCYNSILIIYVGLRKY